VPLPIAKPLAAATPPPLDKITEHLSPPMCSPPVVSKMKIHADEMAAYGIAYVLTGLDEEFYNPMVSSIVTQC
jgi:hypothetical protein